MMKEELFSQLRQAIMEFDEVAARSFAEQSIAEGIDPVETLEVLTDAMRQVGDQFEAGDIFLPELVAASETMTKASSVLEQEIQRTHKVKRTLGVVVIGTVFGDIHDIGKNMVATLFRAAGFSVVDCGANVPAATFIETAIDRHADILALSALLTTTAKEQRQVIKSLEERGLRDTMKVIVGGGGITRWFAESIGADGYSPTASGAVRLGKSLLGIQEGGA